MSDIQIVAVAYGDEQRKLVDLGVEGAGAVVDKGVPRGPFPLASLESHGQWVTVEPETPTGEVADRLRGMRRSVVLRI